MTRPGARWLGLNLEEVAQFNSEDETLMTSAQYAAVPEHLCHRHLIIGQLIPAVAPVPNDLEVVIIIPPLCGVCIEDVDSWLRLFGLRNLTETHIREEWKADDILPQLNAPS